MSGRVWAGDPLVKPKGTRAYHHGRILPDILLDFWILFQRVGVNYFQQFFHSSLMHVFFGSISNVYASFFHPFQIFMSFFSIILNSHDKFLINFKNLCHFFFDPSKNFMTNFGINFNFECHFF